MYQVSDVVISLAFGLGKIVEIAELQQNSGLFYLIEGIEEKESKHLLGVLERAILDPSIQCRIKWEVDTIVMWDNRIVQHHASNDFYPQTRHVERVTIIGDRPF